MAGRKAWNRDELLVALNIYHKLNFGQLHARNPVIIDVANKLGRGANSLAMKLCNFASLDPAVRLRGRTGLPGASALDRRIWNEFHESAAEAVPASEEVLRNAFEADPEAEVEVLPNKGVRVRRGPQSGPTETLANRKIRRGQEYFRGIVLNNYGGRCGITGLGVRELLVASHILPWHKHVSERLNVRNGICLSRLHDAAFDRWLISFDDHLRLLLSPVLKTELPQKMLTQNFRDYEGERLNVPDEALAPEPQFLAEHRRRFDSLSAA